MALVSCKTKSEQHFSCLLYSVIYNCTSVATLEISKMWRWIVQKGNKMYMYEDAKSVQQNVRFWMSTWLISENIHKLKQEEFKGFQVLLYKFKDIQGLALFCFQIPRTCEHFPEVLLSPVTCLHFLFLSLSRKDLACILVSDQWSRPGNHSQCLSLLG